MKHCATKERNAKRQEFIDRHSVFIVMHIEEDKKSPFVKDFIEIARKELGYSHNTVSGDIWQTLRGQVKKQLKKSSQTAYNPE